MGKADHFRAETTIVSKGTALSLAFSLQLSPKSNFDKLDIPCIPQNYS